MKELSESISEIEIQLCDDEQKRHILDSPDKIIRWIKYKFEEQTKEHKKQRENGLPLYRCIDLSNCIISTTSHEGRPSLTNLCDIIYQNEKVKLLDCFINNGYGNKYYHEVLERFICRNSLIHAAFFHTTKFHEDVDFEGTIFNGYASFGRCLFEKGAWFQRTKFSGNFGFDGCTFESDTYFSNAELDIHQVNFSNSIFKGDFIAKNLTLIIDNQINTNPVLKTYLTFAGAEFFKELDLSNNEISIETSFSGTKLYGNGNFTKCNFINKANFDDTEIKGNLLFTSYSDENNNVETVLNTINKISFNRANISGRIDFEKCNIGKMNMNFSIIKSGAIFRIYESYLKDLDLTSLYNNGLLILEDNKANIEKITLKSAINGGVIEIENSEVQINDRKTARLLKDSAQKNGNVIDSLKYKSKEMDLYEKELLYKILNVSKKFKFVGTFLTWKAKLRIYYTPFINFCGFLWEVILLKLNTWSNKNGLSWVRGILFTISVWLIFFGIFIMCREGIGSEFFLANSYYKEEFIKYLWLPNGFDGLFKDSQNNPTVNNSIGWVAITFFVIGKIFIGYGIYQTISAFRKHGK